MSDKEKLAKWMMQHEYATGHGDTIEDLLEELKWQIKEQWERAAAAERETCAVICDRGDPMFKPALTQFDCADLIRARGNNDV